jgi:hypothetical protein
MQVGLGRTVRSIQIEDRHGSVPFERRAGTASLTASP